jgi:hypothetical protein
LAELKRRATARALAGDPGDEREYPMYPADMVSPYLVRFFAAAAQRYKALGIERDDPARLPYLALFNDAHDGHHLAAPGVSDEIRVDDLSRPTAYPQGTVSGPPAEDQEGKIIAFNSAIHRRGQGRQVTGDKWPAE